MAWRLLISLSLFVAFGFGLLLFGSMLMIYWFAVDTRGRADNKEISRQWNVTSIAMHVLLVCSFCVGEANCHVTPPRAPSNPHHANLPYLQPTTMPPVFVLAALGPLDFGNAWHQPRDCWHNGAVGRLGRRCCRSRDCCLLHASPITIKG